MHCISTSLLAPSGHLTESLPDREADRGSDGDIRYTCVYVWRREKEGREFFFIEGAMWSEGCVKWAMTGVTITPLADLPLLCHEQINLWNCETMRGLDDWQVDAACCKRKMNDKKKLYKSVCVSILWTHTYCEIVKWHFKCKSLPFRNPLNGNSYLLFISRL